MELEAIPIELEKLFSEAEKRIMEDVVERIRINGFAGATARWELTRLQQLGESEETLRQTMKELLQASDKQLDLIFSEAVYEAYYTHKPAYSLTGMQQIPYEQNTVLQQLVEATKVQTHGQLENITQTTGFAVRSKGSTQITYVGTQEFYKNTLDAAMIDIHSGAFSYEQVLNRTIKTMTDSGLRYIQYESGRSFRIDSAARMAVSTGFRQVQGHINEEAARQLGTNYYEVPWHAGARPTHQAWQGKVYSYDDLVRVCGLGSVTGLCGANCYHSYLPFIPGVSVRTYTDKWLEEQNTKENTPKEYGGKEYTTYQALQMQRRMERNMRASRESIELLKKGEADEETLTSARANYKAQQQQYRDFSKEMGLPEQLNRVFQDQRGNVTKGLEKAGKMSKMESGGRILDPNGEYERKWAKSYYQEIRAKSTDCAKVAKRAGITVEEAEAIKDYLFVSGQYYNEFEGKMVLFDPDPAIAQSWQRLSEGKKKEVQPFDYTLIQHELYEMQIKKNNPGIDHHVAHAMAAQKYDYQTPAEEYYDRLRKRKEEGK